MTVFSISTDLTTSAHEYKNIFAAKNLKYIPNMLLPALRAVDGCGRSSPIICKFSIKVRKKLACAVAVWMYNKYLQPAANDEQREAQWESCSTGALAQEMRKRWDLTAQITV